MVECACVAPDKVALLWPHVSHFIRRAMTRGGMGQFEDVEKDVLGLNSYLWVASEQSAILAVAITKVTVEPNGRRLCTIVACGGYDWPRFGHLIEAIENYARTEDCRAIEVCGRPGWARLLKYRTAKIILRKELT